MLYKILFGISGFLALIVLGVLTALVLSGFGLCAVPNSNAGGGAFLSLIGSVLLCLAAIGIKETLR